MVSISPLNATALTFKNLHKPGEPLVLANVYDAVTARTVASVPGCKALATTSLAVAATFDLEDDDLGLADNVAANGRIAAVAKQLQLPLTADLQSGYGEQLENGVKMMIDAGVVGCNIEDFDADTGRMYSPEEAAARIARALQAAKEAGVPDFVVNARCDVLVQGGEVEEVLTRGKTYLDAGARTVFVWGKTRGVSTEEIRSMVASFGGMLNVKMKLAPGYLGVKELAELGVARISVGPELQQIMMKTLKHQAEALYAS